MVKVGRSQFGHSMCASKAVFFSYTAQAVTQQIAVTATPQCSPMPSDPLWSRLETKRLPLPASQQLQRQIVITNDPHWLYLRISRCFFLVLCIFLYGNEFKCSAKFEARQSCCTQMEHEEVFVQVCKYNPADNPQCGFTTPPTTSGSSEHRLWVISTCQMT